MPLKSPNTSKIEEKVENSNLIKIKKTAEKSGVVSCISFKLPIEHKQIFETHFHDMGLTFSSGIRMIMYNYLKEKKIEY